MKKELNEREDLSKFNRIAGFYHTDTKHFELFPRTTEEISTEDDEINDYIHNVQSKDELSELNIVRFGIEDIKGEGVVCYIEADTKRNAEDCYYAIIDKYQEDCDIIKYELEYYVGNEHKYLYFDRYGEQLMEGIIHAKSNGDKLTDVVLKNPTRKELEENNIERARCMVDGEGNWYFCDLYNNLHFEIENLLRGSTSFPYYDGNDSYGISYFDVEGNEFWYNSNEMMPKEKCLEQYYKSSYLKKEFPDAYLRENPYGINSEDYENEDIELDEEVNPKLNDAFIKWFKGSKVVDNQGKPLVVYHGTNAEQFNEFQLERENDGFYFTNDRTYAESEGKNVIEAYLSIKNPRIVKYDEETETIEEMKQNGYDGIFITDMGYYVAFYPNQIKSVNNGGRWNGSSQNIFESVIRRDDGEIGGYYTYSANELMSIVENRYRNDDVRVLYDINKKLYVFADTYSAIHFNLLLFMILFTNVYDDIPEIKKNKYASDEVLQDIINDVLYLSRFKIYRNDKNMSDNEFIKYLSQMPDNSDDGYGCGFTCKLNDKLWAICRDDEYNEALQVPLLKNRNWVDLAKYNQLNESINLKKFNRIAGFYHYNTNEWEILERTDKDVDMDTDYDEYVKYTHNTNLEDLIEEDMIRFAIEDVDKVVCVIESPYGHWVRPFIKKLYNKFPQEMALVKRLDIEYYKEDGTRKYQTVEV